jgi:superfamily II DNA or RNA helicase
MFNDKKIKHITAVNILNENANLVDCRIGIFCNLNSSEIITVQRCGRLLRHKNPAIIIPYYVDTREEELMNKMIEGYNPDTIKVINNINEFEL